ncbi:MAG: hypothetical protein IJX13_05915, partial [Clostridia bacterium]|nr:hypothetical protein [Clostridia bacterium]
MKKTVLRILLVAVLVLAMALPMVMIPAMAAESVTYYYQDDFEGYSGNLTNLDDNSSEPFWHYSGTSAAWQAPAAAYITSDPFDASNEVVRFDFEATDTGSVGYDFISYGGDSNNPAVITWNDSAKTSGTVEITSPSSSYNSSYAVTSPDGGKTVLVNGVYKKVYSTAAEKEIIYGGGNVNKNLTFNNTQAITSGTVVFELDLYLSSDANGLMVSQVTGFSTLFSVSLSSAYLEPASGTWKAKLNKGEWNRISVIADLSTGVRDYYVDNVYVGQYTGSITSISARSWIAAMIVRGESQIGNISGYVLLDNANIHSLHSQEIVSASEYTSESLLSATIKTPKGHISNIMGKQALVTPGEVSVDVKYLESTYTNGLLSTNLQKDVSIRLTNTGGVRFATNINTTVLEKLIDLKDEGYIKNVSVGTMIAPLDYVQSVGTFTHEAFDNAGKVYLDVEGKVGSWYESSNLTPDEGFDEIFVGSILNIKAG